MATPGSENAVVAAHLSAQLLTGPSARAVDDVVGRLLAVQAQDDRVPDSPCGVARPAWPRPTSTTQ